MRPDVKENLGGFSRGLARSMKCVGRSIASAFALAAHQRRCRDLDWDQVGLSVTIGRNRPGQEVYGDVHLAPDDFSYRVMEGRLR